MQRGMGHSGVGAVYRGDPRRARAPRAPGVDRARAGPVQVTNAALFAPFLKTFYVVLLSGV